MSGDWLKLHRKSLESRVFRRPCIVACLVLVPDESQLETKLEVRL